MTRAKRLRIALLAAMLGVIAVAFVHRRNVVREEREQDEAERIAADRSASPSVTTDDPIWGAATAPVTIVIFGDIQDPFLAQMLPVLEQVKAHYGPRQLRLVWKDRPALFHPQARPAALAAHAVFTLKGSDAFWSFLARATKQQSELGAQAYERWAAQAGVDLGQFRAARTAQLGEKKLAEDRASLRRLLPSPPEYLPTIYVNGMLPEYLSEGSFKAESFSDFQELIDPQLKLAASLHSEAGSFYATIAHENAEREAHLQRQGGERAPHQPKLQRVPVQDCPVLGPADAIVTIVELSDFACHECRRLAQTLRDVQQKFPSKVRVIWKNRPMPFEPRAEPAAELALEAWNEQENAGFWRAHDKLFASPTLERVDLQRIAGELGLDATSTRTAIDEKRYKSQIARDQVFGLALEEGSWSDSSDYPRYGSVDGKLSPLLLVNGMPQEELEPPRVESYVADAIKHFEQEHGDVPAKDWYDHVIASASLGAGHGFSPPRRPPTAPPKSVFSYLAIHGVGDRTSGHKLEYFDPLPRAAIEQIVSENEAKIRACHERALGSSPVPQGRVFVELSTDRSGTVSLAQDGGSSLPDASVVECVIGALKSLSFPKADRELTSFVLVFQFEVNKATLDLP